MCVVANFGSVCGCLCFADEPLLWRSPYVVKYVVELRIEHYHRFSGVSGVRPIVIQPNSHKQVAFSVALFNQLNLIT